MKKNITIPNVDTDLYEAVKERCRQDGTSISAYFNSLLAGQNEKPLVMNPNKEITRLQDLVDEYSTKVAGLLQEHHEVSELLTKRANTISELSKTIAEQKNTIAEQQSKIEKLEEYEEMGQTSLRKSEELEQKLTAKDAELEEAKKALETMKTQIESLRASSDDGVFVALTPLELALIKHVAEKEQARHEDKSITPSSLLKAMFVNYTIHGDMYFFPHPSRATLRALKAQVEEAEAKHRQTTAEKENNTPQENNETQKGENHE